MARDAAAARVPAARWHARARGGELALGGPVNSGRQRREPRVRRARGRRVSHRRHLSPKGTSGAPGAVSEHAALARGKRKKKNLYLAGCHAAKQLDKPPDSTTTSGSEPSATISCACCRAGPVAVATVCAVQRKASRRGVVAAVVSGALRIQTRRHHSLGGRRRRQAPFPAADVLWLRLDVLGARLARALLEEPASKAPSRSVVGPRRARIRARRGDRPLRARF